MMGGKLICISNSFNGRVGLEQEENDYHGSLGCGSNPRSHTHTHTHSNITKKPILLKREGKGSGEYK